MSQHRVSWEKDPLVLPFRSYFAPSLTLPYEYSGLFMIQMPCIEHLLKAQAVWGWSPWEVSSFSPSSSCSLVSQSWFHLRSSCLCCNLITLNFLEGEWHVISWRLILVCSLEISTHLSDVQNVSLCGRVWLSFFLTQFARPRRCDSQIKHLHPLRKRSSVPRVPPQSDLYGDFSELLKSVLKY